MRHLHITIEGTVQGVGFRPFVYGLANKLQITGSVRNQGGQVDIYAWAGANQLDAFLTALQEETPTLARITAIHQREAKGPQPTDFQIHNSTASSRSTIDLPPDIALCADCRRELFDPTDRRYLYPFINCINCGPRLTIIDRVPYDRASTTMAAFTMCPECRKEFSAPDNRRFHAQPIACPECGPRLFWQADGQCCDGSPALEHAVSALASGRIIALRGLGGFQLVCDAGNEKAIALLRQRKGRPHKPLAVMAADLVIARRHCHISRQEEECLQGPQRPLLLLAAKGDTLPANLSFGLGRLGLMLPTTPLHALLFARHDCPQLLVMTSANISGEPICVSNPEAEEKLAHIAHGILGHDREIRTRVDDSVAQLISGQIRLVRRARGYVPQALSLPWQLPPLLACGPQLKNTITLAQGRLSWTSQHIGNLASPQMADFFEETINHLQDLLEIQPQRVICDLHPDYHSSLFARELNLPLVQVQHHHAHAVAVMAEYGLTEPCLALVLDGTGYGDDNTIWGGELLRVTAQSYQRLGRLSHLPLPGGDRAIKEPWRLACAALHQSGVCHDLMGAGLPDSLPQIAPEARATLSQMLAKGFNCPPASSCGRLFDAFASLLDICHLSSYEGQAAMALESLADKCRSTPPNLPVSLHSEDGLTILDSSAMLRRLCHARKKGEPGPALALAFHHWLIKGFSAMIEQHATNTPIILAGGCLHNALLHHGLSQRLCQHGYTVYSPKQFPANDGAISLGQAVTGGLAHVSGSTHADH